MPSPGQAALAVRFRRQAGWAEADRLYPRLLVECAGDIERGGAIWRVLAPYAGEPATAAVALRFMAAVHRLVLSGRAPELARFYPSAGGEVDGDAAWPAFLAAVEGHEEECRAGTAQPCQTNEVGRAAPLLCGFLDVAAATRRPLRLLEVGCSAGLNLRWDRFDYGFWGDPASPVHLGSLFAAPPRRARTVTVSERAGCDLAPVDPSTPSGELALASFVWPCDSERMTRLRGAIDVARRIPARVDLADAGAWLAERLARPAVGQATVVYHSVFSQYLTPASRSALTAAIERAGAGASVDAPVAWLRMEPAGGGFETRLTLWPQGREALVATSLAHGGATRAR